MKKIIIGVMSLIALNAIAYNLLGNSYELTQLGDGYVLVKIIGQNNSYSTYLYKGDINDIEIEAFINGENSIAENSRDVLSENIDLGVLPSDIYYDLYPDNPYVAIYGGNQVNIHDGVSHSSILSKIYFHNTVSNFNMAFVPTIPYRYQLTSVPSPIDTNNSYLFCSPEGGGLYVIEESQLPGQYEIFQQFNDSHTAQLLSSSIKSEVFGDYLIWAINYWDGTCKIKLIEWDANIDKFKVSQERSWNDEIIDFAIDGNLVRIALLDEVREIDPITLDDVNLPIIDLSIDKLEENYGHISGEKAIVYFNENGTYETINSGNMIEHAFGSCNDPENERVYFSGHDSNPSTNDPGFKIINYKLEVSLNAHNLPGAISLAFNPKNNEAPNYYTVCAVGDDLFMGFNDSGEEMCSHHLHCHSGYRIAIDLDLESNESNGTLIACLKDGEIVQFRRMQCDEPDVEKYFTVGISSSLVCYDCKNKNAIFYYNGDGGNSVAYIYSEASKQSSSVKLPISGTFTDCIYNKESDLLVSGIYDKCQDIYQLIVINNDNFTTDYSEIGNYQLFTNFNEYVYCLKYVDVPSELSLTRLWVENEIIFSEEIELQYTINSIEINEIDDLLYLTVKDQNKVIIVNHNDFSIVNSPNIVLNDPVDIAFNSTVDNPFNSVAGNIYIVQHSYQVVEVYDKNFSFITNIPITGNPKKIEYNPSQNNIYVVSDFDGVGFNYVTIIDCINNQLIKELKIRKSDGYLYDKINDQFYFHTNYPGANDANEFNVKSLNAFNDNFSNQINTEFYSYQDIFLNKKRTVPSKMAINHKDNFIYIGNYGSSIATKIKAYDETFTFKPGWTWLSFPRLERYKDKPFDAIPLLERIDPWPPDYLEMEFIPSNISLSISFDIEFGWNTTGLLTEVQSTEGYKLNYIKEVDDYEIRLEGAKLDYNTEIDLVEGDNWVGYFLDNNLYPQECLPPDLWKDLVQIKTQYWSMTKVPADPSFWFLEGDKAPIEYGDLVILRTSAAYEKFQWQNTSGGTQDKEIPKTSYYTFEEQADYLPFYVETDSTANIQEIALLADGVIKGAAVRETGDTLVEVNGYLEGVDPGAVIEFETWNGYKSQAVEKGAYVVIDHKQQVREKRNIHAGEKATYYHVSLKGNEVYKLPSEISSLSCQPNPFRQLTEFSFQLNKAGNVSLNIYDLTGKQVKSLINGDYPEGYYRFTWQGENETGNQITPGVYFYKLSTGKGSVFSEKIVLIK